MIQLYGWMDEWVVGEFGPAYACAIRSSELFEFLVDNRVLEVDWCVDWTGIHISREDCSDTIIWMDGWCSSALPLLSCLALALGLGVLAFSITSFFVLCFDFEPGHYLLHLLICSVALRLRALTDPFGLFHLRTTPGVSRVWFGRVIQFILYYAILVFESIL